MDRQRIVLEPSRDMTVVAKTCSGWCWPLIIYILLVALSFLSMLMSGQNLVNVQSGLLWNLLWSLLFGFILYWLCSNCYEGWAWILLLLPLLILGFIVGTYIFGYSLGAGFAQGQKMSDSVIDLTQVNKLMKP